MRVILCLLLSAVCVLADKNGNRRTKPFIADAVGNTLPPPSNVPATVGSPISLLTPDRYEFYTFDESGELVKRLMTLEEIQAIVAAGEDSEGLVTFSNDNQPTIAFNFSQPPYTKVHSVVTNVQNVLKAQMEAHKNKPLVQPTLDTPDVSDSWSLILPSIFGNSGVDIVPDKSGSSFTPETDTIEENLQIDDEENSLSKEGGVPITTSTTEDNSGEKNTQTETSLASTTSTTSTTTTSTTTVKPTTTTRPLTTTTRKKLVTTTRPRTTTTKTPETTTTTKQPSTTKVTTTTTTILPSTSKPTTTTILPSTNKPTTTTKRPTTTTTTTTTTEPTTTVIPRTTTRRPTVTTKKYAITTSTVAPEHILSNDIPTANPIEVFEKISTFIPVSTVKYVTQRTTHKPLEITKAPFVYASTTKRSPTTTAKSSRPLSSTQGLQLQTTTTSTTTKDPELERVNLTTITTQSVSPSTTVSSTEYISLDTYSHSHPENEDDGLENDLPILPIFDVAQSISQIASDLGNNYQPIPTSSNLLDTTKVTNIEDMESKENLDMDIPAEDQANNKNQTEDKFVKISTIDPHPEQNIETQKVNETEKETEQIKTTTDIAITTENAEITTLVSVSSGGTTIDPILTESIDDLLSQVVHEVPQSILDTKKTEDDIKIATTEKVAEITTELTSGSTTETSTSVDIVSSTQKISLESEKEAPVKVTTEKVISPDKEINKNISSSNNKVDSYDKLNKPEEDTKDFVKITMPTTETSTSNIEINNKNYESVLPSISKETNSVPTLIPQKSEEFDDNKKKVEQKIEEPHEEVTTTTKVDTTTKQSSPSNDTMREQVTTLQSNINKISVGEKINIINKKDKISDTVPKIDEFKKKIQKINDEELANDRNDPWKLIPTVHPPKGNDLAKEKNKPDVPLNSVNDEDKDVVLEFSKENQGLEVTTKDLGEDIAQFTELCNELAFRYWNTMVENIDEKRSFVLSPYSITSMLAMMFMGARGATSGEMNEILKLDDMVTFNPHFTLKNISDSIESATNSGIVVSAFVRELFSDRNKGKILTFYKERAQHFYSGHVEEINFKLISDIIRRRTNLLVKKHTWGKIPEYMKTNNIVMKPPLAAFSTNIFQTDCLGTSVDGRDGEMYFVVSPNVRQRRLVPVPAVVYRTGFLAGYDPVLDATAAALGNMNSIVSTIFLMPGQQGNVVHADDLVKLEQRLLESNPTTPAWSRVLRTLLPRVGLELQIPRFSHKSVFNVSSTLREMGLKDLFDADHADLGGLIGPSKDLYLSDMIQVTSFVTCGEGLVGEQHHIEEYPETAELARRRSSRWADWDEPRDYQRAFHDPHDVGEAMHLPLHLRPRQARLPTRSVQPARLKFDRPFLFFVRHNPSGMILYVGRYNPRLLP